MKSHSKVVNNGTKSHRDMRQHSAKEEQLVSRKRTLRASACRNTSPTNSLKNKSWARSLQKIQGDLLFESHHSLEAIWSLFWYCWGHLSLYMFLFYIAKLVQYQQTYLGVHSFHGLLIGVAVALMRCNGHLWEWLLVLAPPNNDCKNRPSFWNKTKNWNPHVSLVAFYLFYLGVAHFYYQLWAFHDQGIRLVYSTYMEETCSSSSSSLLLLDDNGPAALKACCGWLYRIMCEEFQNSDEELLPLSSILFNGIICTVSAMALAMMGGSLFETS